MPHIPNTSPVVRKQMVRGKRGVFLLCSDATNGRIYYRGDGKRNWSRFKGPDSPHNRLSLAAGKRGLFCVCGDGAQGSIWFRSFAKDSTWTRYRGPAATDTGRRAPSSPRVRR